MLKKGTAGSFPETILGIDPGSRIAGYGVLTRQNRTYHYVASGSIRLDVKASFNNRLRQLFLDVQTLIETYQPTVLALESAFLNKNVSSAMKLGQARGVIIAAVGDIDIAEYAPRAVKQAVVGYGAAEKNQVQEMIQRLLKLPGKPPPDAADALAVALCHVHSSIR